jgi:hypothetical protein
MQVLTLDCCLGFSHRARFPGFSFLSPLNLTLITEIRLPGLNPRDMLPAHGSLFTPRRGSGKESEGLQKRSKAIQLQRSPQQH